MARPAEEITIYDVMQAVAPLPRIRTCPLGIKAHGTALCPVHRRLDSALAMVEQAFRDSTIASLVADDSGSMPLCDPERPAVTKINIKRKKSVGATT